MVFYKVFLAGIGLIFFIAAGEFLRTCEEFRIIGRKKSALNYFLVLKWKKPGAIQ